MSVLFFSFAVCFCSLTFVMSSHVVSSQKRKKGHGPSQKRRPVFQAAVRTDEGSDKDEVSDASSMDKESPAAENANSNT